MSKPAANLSLPEPGAGMYLSRLDVTNFRSCYDSEFVFQPTVTVVVGENNSGKSNLIDSLRLFTAPSGGRRSRYFEKSDLAVGAPTSTIELCGQFVAATEAQRALHLPALDLNSGTIVYGTRFTASAGRRSRPDLYAGPAKASDSEVQAREAIQHVYLAPLRDAQRALDSGSGDRLSAVIEMLFTEQEQQDFLKDANTHLGKLKDHTVVTKTTEQIQTHVERLTSPVRGQAVGIDFVDQELRRLARSLRMKMAEYGVVPADLAESGLGYANLLFIATVMLELRKAKDADLTIFLVEEPEAHLHPQLQMVLLDYLQEQAVESVQPDSHDPAGRIQVIATTHSPNVASAVSVKNVVVLKSAPRPLAPSGPTGDGPEVKPPQADGIVAVLEAQVDNGDGEPSIVEQVEEYVLRPRSGTKAVAISKLGLADEHLRKIDQYLDATRASLLFARSIVLVEGIGEAVLLPVLARSCVFKGEELADKKARQRFHAVTVIAIGSVDFEPYVRLLLSLDGGSSIADRLIVVTDADPDLDEDEDEDENEGGAIESVGEAEAPGAASVPKTRRERLEEAAGECDAADKLKVFEATYTLEADLLGHSANEEVLRTAFLAQRTRSKKRWDKIIGESDRAKAFYAALRGNHGLISKGRFAHDAALGIAGSTTFVCPEYLANAIREAVA